MKHFLVYSFSIYALLAITLSCTSRKPDPQLPESEIRIEVKSVIIQHDTAVNACVSIMNGSDTTISIFPPEFGSVLPTSYYGFASNSDTIWLGAATDMDYDTYPEVVIPAHYKYTFFMRPGFFELWHRGISARSDDHLKHLINSSKFFGVRYLTALIDSLDENSSQIESVSVKKYQRYRLESRFTEILNIQQLCDTGVARH